LNEKEVIERLGKTIIFMENKKEHDRKRLKKILDKYRKEIIKRCKEHPPNDYQDLWYLSKTFHDELRKLLEET